MANISVLGAGIVGLWQALTLARRGHRVRLIEKSDETAPFDGAASHLAGAMLAPFCEAEAAEPLVRDLGLRSLDIWRQTYPGVKPAGTLVIAQARDRAELTRFANMTEAFEWVDDARIAELEPALEGRYQTGLYYPQEAHICPVDAMDALLGMAREAGVETVFGADWQPAGDESQSDSHIVDCRGLGAQGEFRNLRGVRGEMLVVETREIELGRPVRLLHPRFPIYVVPWGDGRFMIGATVIESGDRSNVSVRSALELLGTAYALHPAFGEARIVSFAADARPAFPDNVPRIIIRDHHIHVNGLYRHGFLTSPGLAELVADYIETGAMQTEVVVEDKGEW